MKIKVDRKLTWQKPYAEILSYNEKWELTAWEATKDEILDLGTPYGEALVGARIGRKYYILNIENDSITAERVSKDKAINFALA